MYADNGYSRARLEKWTVNATNSIVILNVSGACTGIFIDIYNSFYCSSPSQQQVWKKPIDGDGNSSVIVAGNGFAGSASNTLSSPYGIFVDLDLSLYVADFSNNRVQLFRSGQLNATTVAGNGAPGTVTLSNPIAVILDADGYSFIVDYGHHRIVRSGPNGFRCIAGCSGTSGAAGNQLAWPRALSFDSYGNMYIADAGNNRIQKFFLARNACGKSLDDHYSLS